MIVVAQGAWDSRCLNRVRFRCETSRRNEKNRFRTSTGSHDRRLTLAAMAQGLELFRHGDLRLLRLWLAPLPRDDARAKRSMQRVEIFLGSGELETKLKVREIREEAAAHIRFPINLVGGADFVSLDLAIYEH